MGQLTIEDPLLMIGFKEGQDLCSTSPLLFHLNSIFYIIMNLRELCSGLFIKITDTANVISLFPISFPIKQFVPSPQFVPLKYLLNTCRLNRTTTSYCTIIFNN